MGQFFLAEEWWGKYRISRRSLFKPAAKMRVISRTCGRESSIWIRCVWTWKFLNPERKICGFKNIQIRVDGALEKWQTYRELTGCHRFSCRPVLLISCVVVRPSCVQKWILLEWLFSVLPFLVFPTQGMHAITDTKWSLFIFLTVCYHQQHHRRHFRCRPRHHHHRHFHHHRHHGRHHHHYVTFNLTLLKKCK